MVLPRIGYIICEAESSITGFDHFNIVQDKKEGRVIAEGILQTVNEKNRNGRFYSSEELFPQLVAPRTKELLEAGYLRAELGHPMSTQLVRQQTIDDSRTCARFIKLWTEGDNVWGRFMGTNNAFGEAFDKDLRDGCKPAWSLRALGTIENTSRGAEVRNLHIITYDQVIYPSHPGAYTQRLVSESAGYEKQNDMENKARIIPFQDQDVIRSIQTESANIKLIKESLDFMYKDIVVSEDGSKAILTTTTGEVIVVNLEDYITKEIRNYAADLATP